MKITKEYLQGVVDTLYNSQTPLLGFEIEEEKNFNMSVSESHNGFIIELTWIESYKESKYENDTDIPVYGSQVILANAHTKFHKLVKDIIAEMEMIYNLACPEVEQAPIKEYVGV